MTNDVGRSMVETLGMLALMGILSIVGIGAYRGAVDKNKANTLIQEAQKRAIIVAGQIGFNNQTPSLAEFSPPNSTVGGTLGDVKTTGLTKQFGIEVSGVKKRICENILQTIGENTPIRRLSKADTPTTPITSCDEDNPFLFIYNNDMTGNDTVALPKSCRTVNDCASACATCEIPEDEEVGICTNECEEPVRLCQTDNDCKVDNECNVCNTESGLCKNGCQRVEYLESTGTQYIDTGYYPNNTTRYKLRTQFLNPTTTQNYMGIIGVSVAPNDRCGMGFYNGKIRQQFGSGTAVYGGNYNDSSYTGFNNPTIYECSRNGFYINGVLNWSPTKDLTGTSSVTAWLFNTHAEAEYSGTPQRLYYCKIYDNETLVRDFVPVIAPNGKACMFNKVKEDGKLKLYCDANGGTFKTNKDN